MKIQYYKYVEPIYEESYTKNEVFSHDIWTKNGAKESDKPENIPKEPDKFGKTYDSQRDKYDEDDENNGSDEYSNRFRSSSKKLDLSIIFIISFFFLKIIFIYGCLLNNKTKKILFLNFL